MHIELMFMNIDEYYDLYIVSCNVELYETDVILCDFLISSAPDTDS